MHLWRGRVSSTCACNDRRRTEKLTSESAVRQPEHQLFLALLLATYVAAPVTHFISFEVGNFVDGP